MPELEQIGDAWVDGMLLSAMLLGLCVALCLFGLVVADNKSQRRSAARAALVMLMAYVLVPLWPLVVVGGVGYGLVKLVKTADFATWMDKRSA